MAIVMLVIFGLGWLVAVVGSVMFLVAAFREHVLWGVAVLFIPFANLVFLFKYWPEAKPGFLLQLLGVLIAIGGVAAGGTAGASRMAAMAGDMPGMDSAELQRIMAEAQVARETKTPPPARVDVRDRPEDADAEYVGRTLLDIRNELGPPKGTITARGTTTVFYTGLELVSADGETVMAQRVVAE